MWSQVPFLWWPVLAVIMPMPMAPGKVEELVLSGKWSRCSRWSKWWTSLIVGERVREVVAGVIVTLVVRVRWEEVLWAHTATWRCHFNKICSQSEQALRASPVPHDLPICHHVSALLTFFMATLCNRAGHIYFHPVVSSFFSSPNLSGQRLDVYHTSTHGVALAQI